MNLHRTVYVDSHGTLGDLGISSIRGSAPHPFVRAALRSLSVTWLLVALVPDRRRSPRGEISCQGFAAIVQCLKQVSSTLLNRGGTAPRQLEGPLTKCDFDQESYGECH